MKKNNNRKEKKLQWLQESVFIVFLASFIGSRVLKFFPGLVNEKILLGLLILAAVTKLTWCIWDICSDRKQVQ